MQTAEEIYAATVRQLPLRERLRLAELILNDATENQSDVQTDTDFNIATESEVEAALDYLNTNYSRTLQRLAE